MRKVMVFLAIGFFATSLCLGATLAVKGKYTNKQVMKKAMKGGLCKKIAGGGGDAKEKLELLHLFVSLSENKPKKGEAASWKAKTDALIVASAKVVAGSKDGAAALKKAANCGACHKAHK